MNVIKNTVCFYKNLLAKRSNLNPCEEWSGLMSKMCLVSQPLSSLRKSNVTSKKNVTSLVLAFLLLLTAVRFAFDATLDKVNDRHLLHICGAVFHSLGLGGKIIYVTCLPVYLGAAINRWILMWKENKGKLCFLFRVSVEKNPTASLLEERFRQKFVRFMTFCFWTSVWSEVCLNATTFMIYMVFLAYTIWEENSYVIISAWIAWYVATIPAFMVLLNDMVIISASWLVSREHLDIQLSQLQSHLVESYFNLNVKREHVHRILKRLFKEYQGVVDRIHEFDETSRLLIWTLTYSTTLLNSTFMYAVIVIGRTFLGYLCLVAWFQMTLSSLTLLYSATSIARKGKQLYFLLNSIYVRQNNLMNLKEKTMMRHLIEHTGNENIPSITLFNAERIPYDTYSFSEYVLTTALTFIICVNFLDKVLT